MDAVNDNGTAAADINSTIIDEALLWFVRVQFDTPSVEELERLRNWLDENEQHRQAWQLVSEAQGRLQTLPAEMSRRTLSQVAEHRKHRQVSRRSAIKTLSVGGLLTASAVGAEKWTPWQRLVADSSTAIGEQKQVALGRNIDLFLNTDTAVSTQTGAGVTTINLLRGEVEIDIRQFSPVAVNTGFGQLHSRGERLVIRRQENLARVDVLAGDAQIQDPLGRLRPLRNGESAQLTGDAVKPLAAPRFAVDGWRQGVISGENIPLADLVHELGRYRVGHLSCDPEIQNLAVSGVFQIHDTDQALAFLQQTQPVKIKSLSAYWVRVVPA